MLSYRVLRLQRDKQKQEAFPRIASRADLEQSLEAYKLTSSHDGDHGNRDKLFSLYGRQFDVISKSLPRIVFGRFLKPSLEALSRIGELHNDMLGELREGSTGVGWQIDC